MKPVSFLKSKKCRAPHSPIDKSWGGRRNRKPTSRTSKGVIAMLVYLASFLLAGLIVFPRAEANESTSTVKVAPSKKESKSLTDSAEGEKKGESENSKGIEVKSDSNEKSKAKKAKGKKGSQSMIVLLETTLGPIKIKLNSEKAPVTVDNFLQYVDDGFYNGTIFHRVIKGFMVQGGGFTPDMNQKTTRSPIKNEANNRLSNKRGTLAMARTGDPHSASAQFFINTVDNDFLNFKSENIQGWGYAVFGEVIEGMDIVDKITNVPTSSLKGFDDVPQTPVEIKTAKRVEK